MKCTLFLFIILGPVINVNGQSKSMFDIEYQVRFNDAFDRGRKDRMHKGHLLINENLTRFYMTAVEKYTAANEYDHGFEPDTNILVYTDQSRGYIVAREYGFDGKPFFLYDSLYPMQWKIMAETRVIDTLQCTMATCRFRGRNYIAWFCPDIPLPYGPWKMGGLPGLIIELIDEQDNMLMSLTSISKTDNRFDIPVDVMYTMEEHIRKMKNLLKKLQGNARTAGSGDCLSCQTESKYEFFTWEIIPR
jgi:GLPGLI family protein